MPLGRCVAGATQTGRDHELWMSRCVSLVKIPNDIRWLGSGPRGGLGEDAVITYSGMSGYFE